MSSHIYSDSILPVKIIRMDKYNESGQLYLLYMLSHSNVIALNIIKNIVTFQKRWK
jgi:hypothetical protein